MVDNNQNEIDLQMEENLRCALKGKPAIPSPGMLKRVDDAVSLIIDAKVEQIQRANRRWRVLRTLRYAGAAAAVIVLVLGLNVSLFHWQRGNKTTATGLPMTGLSSKPHSVDIVDVYLMARTIKAGESLPPQYDFNNDGRVDDQDVHTLALRAVSVSSVKGDTDV